MEQFGSQWIFMKFYSGVFFKICVGISGFNSIWQLQRVIYKKAKIYFWLHLTQFFLEWEMFQIKAAEKIKTRFLCSMIFFLEKRADYEIVWKNVVEPDKPQMTIWRKRIALWVP